MKKIKYIILSGFAALALASCNDLTLQPKGLLDESALFGNDGGIKKYLAGIYMFLPIEDFNYNVHDGYYAPGNEGSWNTWQSAKWYLSNITGETIGWQASIQDGSAGFGYWPYDKIRDINTLIEGLPNYKANYNDATYNSLMGEARFLRAFYYFGMAKRYGGIPIITRVQAPTEPADSLNVYRATEYDTYMFIHNDLQFAMNNMSSTSEDGRANKYVAAALMSRAMLYAATIAKYGSYTTSSPEAAAQKGYVGIPADKASYFFTEAYNACTLFDGSSYVLVGENAAAADKEQNYVDLFLTKNKEDIFIQQYDAMAPRPLELFHSYDATTSPYPAFSSWNPGSEWYPTLEIVELFQKLPIENAAGIPTRYNTREELWQNGNLEPRLLANVFFPGMSLRGSKFDVRRGLYKTYTGTQADAKFGDATAPINSTSNRLISGGPTYPIPGSWGVTGNVVGAHGVWTDAKPENHTETGLFVRKYVDYHKTVTQTAIEQSTQPWKAFRYAEIVLNKAEAAYELGKAQESYALIARIRNRAGATPWTPSASPATVYTVNGQAVDENLQFIRDERARELLFENHRWWDVRRWRVADQIFSQFTPTGLMPYLVTGENKYIFIREYSIGTKRFTFNAKDYYEPIPGGEINKNNNLIQNPIY